MNREDQEFEQRARTALDSSVTALDADTRRRLAAGRARALEQKSFFARWLTMDNWVPATAFAAIAVLAVTLFVANRHADAPVQVAQSDSDFALELLLGSDTEDEEDDKSGQTADTDPDFFIVMDAMMDEEDKQHAG
jgi:anti-sigma-K factor RskA